MQLFQQKFRARIVQIITEIADTRQQDGDKDTIVLM